MYNILEKFKIGIVQSSDVIAYKTANLVRNLHINDSEFSFGEMDNSLFYVNQMDIDNMCGRFLITANSSGNIFLFDILDWQEVKCQNLCAPRWRSPKKHNGLVQSVRWYPNDNGMFVSAGTDKKVHFWDVEHLEVADTVKVSHYLHSFDVSSRGILATALNNGEIAINDIRYVCKSLSAIKLHSGAVFSCAWSPFNDKELLSGGEDGNMNLIDIRKPNSALLTMNKYSSSLSNRMSKSFPSVLYVNFIKNGSTMVGFSRDYRFQVWNVAGLSHTIFTNRCAYTKKTRLPFQLPITEFTKPNYVFIPLQSDIAIYELHTGKHVYTLDVHTDVITSCIFNVFTNELYTADVNGALYVWSGHKSVNV